MSAEVLRGRLVLDDEVVAGRLTIEDGWIRAVEPDPDDAVAGGGPIYVPGFIDVHVHGWGGHDATGDADALSGMARALLRRGVTSFLPTAPTLPFDELPRFADRVRAWTPEAPPDGAQPLGFNLEGPFLARARKGAHEASLLREPAGVDAAFLDPLLDGLRIMTVAPELPGALELIARLAAEGVAASLGHSQATLEQARAGYAAGARTTTHLFNAMTGVDHRAPGLAVAALGEDAAYVELIADGIHVHPALWPLVARSKPQDRLLLISDALPVAGSASGRGRIGALEVEVQDGRAVVAGTETLAGSVIALDTAVRNVAAGHGLPAAIRAAAGNPAALLGADDRGRLVVGGRAHLVELDEDLRVRRVTRGNGWIEGAG
ncbi:MAG TPA: N-acetylglucosamine-6-phosphate deacetylase [Candidatus Limnocylindrales bacterium]|nr:N-acetylglucosamine-6-phosphate deacetylase [Candidatus Limnocylindrales bacterium]